MVGLGHKTVLRINVHQKKLGQAEHSCGYAMRCLITVTAASALLVGCSSVVLKASDVKGWPLKSATAQITCDSGQPIKAKLDNGITYALNGTTATREGLPTLNHDSGQFLPNPDSELRALGMKFALSEDFNTAAETACSR